MAKYEGKEDLQAAVDLAEELIHRRYPNTIQYFLRGERAVLDLGIIKAHYLPYIAEGKSCKRDINSFLNSLVKLEEKVIEINKKGEIEDMYVLFELINELSEKYKDSRMDSIFHLLSNVENEIARANTNSRYNKEKISANENLDYWLGKLVRWETELYDERQERIAV